MLEAQGNLSEAAAEARTAVRDEPGNWRNWLTLSRIEARSGDAQQATSDFAHARALNPRWNYLHPPVGQS